MRDEEESVGQTVEGYFRQEENNLLLRHHQYNESIGLSREDNWVGVEVGEEARARSWRALYTMQKVMDCNILVRNEVSLQQSPV